MLACRFLLYRFCSKLPFHHRDNQLRIGRLERKLTKMGREIPFVYKGGYQFFDGCVGSAIINFDTP